MSKLTKWCHFEIVLVVVVVCVKHVVNFERVKHLDAFSFLSEINFRREAAF